MNDQAAQTGVGGLPGLRHAPQGAPAGPGQGPGPALLLLKPLSLFALLGIWWLTAVLAADPARLPSPQAVARFAVTALLHGTLLFDLAVTLARVAAAFLLSMVLGAAIGVLAGRSRRADGIIDPWLIVALNLPVLVVVVLAYIWVGLNDVAAVLAVTIAKLPTVAVTMREGARALDPKLDELATVFRLPAGRRWRHVLLPQLAPYLAAAARGGLSITWKIVLIVELLGRPDGVGFRLNLFFQNFDVTGIFAYGLVFAAIMLALEVVLLQPMERRANAWR